MDFEYSDFQRQIMSEVTELCKKFPPEYWRELDRKRLYPEEFVKALTDAGWLAALIPQEYGGAGLGVLDTCCILQAINRAGCNSIVAHAQMYTMGAILRHGSKEMKERYLPKIAKAELRLQAFGVTEPQAGLDTTKITTQADKQGDKYVVNGHKIFTSRYKYSDLMLLLARTTPYDKAEKKTMGMTLFLVDTRKVEDAIEARQIETMINHHTYELWIRNLEVPEENVIGEVGKGFYHLLDGLNVERCITSSECIGDSYWCIEKATNYAKQRIVFGRPIGMNQSIQHPIAEVLIKTQAAELMRNNAASLFDQGKPCGKEANMAKYLSSEAVWQAANVAVVTHGGLGVTVEADVERKFREARLMTIAPISNQMVLNFIAEHVLDLPRSY